MTENHVSASPRATKPDIDLTDGAFYADRPASREVYRWMRTHEPTVTHLTPAMVKSAILILRASSLTLHRAKFLSEVHQLSFRR